MGGHSTCCGKYDKTANSIQNKGGERGEKKRAGRKEGTRRDFAPGLGPGDPMRGLTIESEARILSSYRTGNEMSQPTVEVRDGEMEPRSGLLGYQRHRRWSRRWAGNGGKNLVGRINGRGGEPKREKNERGRKGGLRSGFVSSNVLVEGEEVCSDLNTESGDPLRPDWGQHDARKNYQKLRGGFSAVPDR